MLKFLFLAFFIGIGLCHKADITILDERSANGDENELVSIDLKKADGSEDIIVKAQMRFHLNNGQVHVNGHPIVHGIVNFLSMRISIIEIVRGTQKAARLAPVKFRVLVSENVDANGVKKLIVEEEFIKVEGYEVLQVDVTQIVWENSIRKPITSITLEDSVIHHKDHEKDHRVFVTDPHFKPRLPEHGLRGDEEGYEHHHKHHKHHHHGHRHHGHHHQHGHSKIRCWFSRLSMGGKIAVVFGGVVTLIGIVSSLIICWKRSCTQQQTLNVPAPVTFSEVPKGDEVKDKVAVSDDGQFHLELNACYVDVDDKKSLVN